MKIAFFYFLNDFCEYLFQIKKKTKKNSDFLIIL